MSNLNRFLSRIEAREAVVGIVGLGYVGLPIAVAFSEAGFRVIGIDSDATRVARVTEGKSYLRDISDERIRQMGQAGRLSASNNYELLSEADAVLMCLPTPLLNGSPDLSRVKAGARALSRVLRSGALVVLESTTYPGTTEELLLPILRRGDPSGNRKFFLAYSPERIDPGNPNFSLRDIPKVVGGIDPESALAVTCLYEQVVTKVFAVSGTREAELAKLIENTFRHVNIALVNELAVYAHDLHIDIWEAIEAAATKPFGYLPFWPGPGWGGHCIPLDPAYLSWRVKRDRAHEVKFVELAHAVNAEMSRYVVERAALCLNDVGKPVRDSRLLCIGAAYKGGTEDTRGSPAIKVMEALARRGAIISYHDPLVPEILVNGRAIRSMDLSLELEVKSDLILILAAQDLVDWERLRTSSRRILDCCNALGVKTSNIERL